MARRAPTTAANLWPLCRGTHRLKPHTETTVQVQPDGSAAWTLPSGRTYHVPADPLLDHPDPDPPSLRDALRALRRHGPPAASAASPDEDVPPF